ncbi:hypothetical protein RJ641_001378 [Dillenia turbinata]|uniref:DUF7356 domain-containing protein n=1 Tax=Dillenia turbinata TaxID=194707 RepID=A0AAN8WA81_9MAGN
MKMEKIRMLLVVSLFLSLLVTDSSCSDSSKVEGTETTLHSLNPKKPSKLDGTDSSSEKIGGSDSKSNPVQDSKKVKENGDVNGSKDSLGSDVGKNNSLKANGVENKESSSEGSESKEVPKERTDKGNPQGCGLSNICTDDKNNFTACLRAQGDESPNLSLLIQNRGEGPLTVKIHSNESVRFEKTKILVQGKHNEEVPVHIEDARAEDSITLTAGDANHDGCNLYFRDLDLFNSGQQADSTLNSTRFSFLKSYPFTVIIILAVPLSIASTWAFVINRCRKVHGSGSKYQKLDNRLPITDAAKIPLECNDGWNSGWDDNWDDEEAPKTPSKPATPSLSAKGLASRRFNREGWKE